MIYSGDETYGDDITSGPLDDEEPECLEHDDPADCEGPVLYRPALSGSGESYPRCDKGYDEYVTRVQPRMDAIRERYPDTPTPPDWFDPTYAGESWNEES